MSSRIYGACQSCGVYAVLQEGRCPDCVIKPVALPWRLVSFVTGVVFLIVSVLALVASRLELEEEVQYLTTFALLVALVSFFCGVGLCLQGILGRHLDS